MTHSKTLTFIILLISLSLKVFGQSLENFADVLKTRRIGQKVTKIVGQDISERTFLGYIKDKKGNTKYYVVTEFLRIKAAIVYHGHSRILFFNAKQKLVQESVLSMPYELPFRLKANVFLTQVL
ncbi:hypothetical protein [Pedobacter sandarakinus]|uniref:hypothetical protein n=1 Tax=Pedobacter sandarakinus TaxID=353156 RepID=UPI002246D204|nr:hypothetical protein [Pedobacter sandarakinus]MCX2574644.1 hypothetical protein [Pedobacter sandarakinus]